MLKLRDYQEDAVKSVFDYFRQGGRGNPLIALPTGTGKSLVIAAFMKRAYEMYGPQRFLLLTHVKELIQQNFAELLGHWPTAPAGIFSAGLKRRDIGFPITAAGIASVKDMAADFGRQDIIIVDEAHLVSNDGASMYRKFFDASLRINPKMKVLGLSATPFRVGQGTLVDPGGIYTDICYDATSLHAFNKFFDEGYLCPVVAPSNVTKFDLTGVRTTAGDYNKSDLEEAIDRPDVTERALREALYLASDRNHWLVFAAGVNHVKHVVDMLDRWGIPTTMVHSKMKEDQRDRNIADFVAGKYRVMVNNGVLTTGFNYKAIDCIVMLRPTKSAGLWVQMLGRGTRPLYAPGHDLSTANGRLWAIFESEKKNCLVLDFAGNTERLGPINDPRVPRSKKSDGGGGSPPFRICEKCGCYNSAAAVRCFNCGNDFPRMVNIQDQASTGILIARNEMKLVDFPVTSITYARHEKKDRPASLLVTYVCGIRYVREWICLEHEGLPRVKAINWWRRRAPNTPIPSTVLEAIERSKELQEPYQITVNVNVKPEEIVRHDFASDRDE